MKNEWIKVKDRLPSVIDDGEKVLIYRLSTDSQISMSISIYETSKVKHCNQEETWWMQLPHPPENSTKIKRNSTYDSKGGIYPR